MRLCQTGNIAHHGGGKVSTLKTEMVEHLNQALGDGHL
jgi:hypothetical protein